MGFHNKAWTAVLAAGIVLGALCDGHAQDQSQEKVHDIGTVQVMEQGTQPDIEIQPAQDVINVETYKTPGEPSNLVDILKDLPIVDFRLESDLIPDDDSVFLRGFGANRFSTAMNGLTIRQSGGRKSSHIVDYGALLPMSMIEDITVLPGPHSALYPAKSFGGVIDIKPRTPKRREELKPDLNLSSSYRSYNTHNHNADAHGAAGPAIYDFSVQKYHTDGYLRNTEADIDTYYGRGGYVFEDEGFLTLSYLYVDARRELAVDNDPDNAATEFDDDYPTVPNGTSEFDYWQDPHSDKIAHSLDMHLQKPSPIGEVSVALTHRTENHDRQYDQISAGKVVDGSWDTKWEQRAIKVSDDIQIADDHELIVGIEGSQLFDGYGRTNWVSAYNRHERIRTQAGFAEHNWDVTDHLHLRLGTRYEVVDAWVVNRKNNGTEYIKGRGDWIKRKWEGVTPKSFLTYELDGLGEDMRDTSVSVGVSRIWRAPDYHGDINPQGRPAGAWLKPEHGMGYDLVLQRRLWGDIELKTDFSFYEIKDYIAYNKSHSELADFEDYRINLKSMHRRGVEVMLGGHILDDLSFYAGYAFTEFENQGDEPAGKEEQDQRARNRFNAGIKYNLFESTTLLADYKYQDREIIEIVNETSPNVYESTINRIDASHVVNLAVEQVLLEDWGFVKDTTLKVFVNNLFDERYENVDGYPATDRTYGMSVSISL